MRAEFLISLCVAAHCAAKLPSSVFQGNGCPSSRWVQHNQNCYILLHATSKNMWSIDSAQEICKDYGANLVSISTEEENEFLSKRFQVEWNGPKNILLGLFYDSDDNSLKWLDDSDVNFTNWGKEPNMDHNNLITCTTMSTFTGLWDLVSCEDVAEMGALCKKQTTPVHGDKLTDPRTTTIILLVIIVLLVLSVAVVLLVLRKRGSGFPSRNQPLSGEVRPYSDEAILVDTVETEDTT